MSWIGPLLVGLAAWCAAGTLAVESAASASVRVAALAPWWVGVVGVAIASQVRAWRQWPLTTWPAALSVLPWLPVPLPPVALIWTGPLAWAPVMAAYALAVGLDPLRAVSQRLRLSDPARGPYAAAALAALLASLAGWSANVRTPGGDEPHYLVIAQSLLADGDVYIQNQHEAHSYTSFHPGDLPPHFRRRGSNGQIISIHAPGVPALVAPLFSVAGYTGARIVIVSFTAFGAALVWYLCWLVTSSAGAAWFGWSAVVLTPTFALQSVLVFPDGPGLMLVAAGAVFVVRLARGDVPSPLLCGAFGSALALLPWLHTRFAVLASVLGLITVVRMLAWPLSWSARMKRIAVWVALPAVSAVAWLLFFKFHYGTYDPRAPYPPEEQRLSWIVPAILGLFYDGQFGIAAYAPAVTAAWFGIWRTTGSLSRRLTAEFVFTAMIYLAAISTIRMWWGGTSPPARLLTAALPLFAPLAAVTWARSSERTRVLWSTLAVTGGVVTGVLVVVERARMIWNVRNAEPLWLEWLSPVVNLSRVWPGFFRDEPRFPLHVAAWLAVGVTTWWVVRQLRMPHRHAVAVWFMASLTMAMPVGWTLTAAEPLDPAPAQLAVVAHSGDGAPLVRIDGGRCNLSRMATLASLSIVSTEAGLRDETRAPLSLVRVPAGRYTVRVRSTAAGVVRVQPILSREGQTWATYELPGPGTFTFPLLVPGRMPRLLVDSAAVDRAQLAVALIPDRGLPRGGVGPVSGEAQLGAIRLLFLAGRIYPESEGVWVGGRTEARLAFMPAEPAGRPLVGQSLVLLLRNGGASAHEVTLNAEGHSRTLVMEPFEEHAVTLRLDDEGIASIGIRTTDGFVPAEQDPESRDRRFLGLRLEIQQAPGSPAAGRSGQ